jgi:DNA-binding CsgD family transcriptional regulator
VSAFVGRAHELAVLAEVARSASRGVAAGLVIGEAGSGKSRLLAEARSRARLADSVEVLGYEPERHVPLASAAQLLRRLTEVPEHGPRLEALLLHADEARALEPVRIFEAAHRSFRTLEPALLAIDDLQWMDDLSYALCHYLIRAARESRQRIAVFASTRPGERGAELPNLLPDERVSRIELAPLTLEEGIELASAIDPSMDPSQAGEVWEIAKGSPFWLEALVRAGSASAGRTDLLTVRMRAATPDARELLSVLAVVGRPVPATRAADILDWPRPRIEAALAELRSRGIAVETGGAVRLTHDLIREAALAGLSEEARQALHRRLAEQFEIDAGDDLRPLREALEHRRAAGMPTLDLARRIVGSSRRTLLGPDGLRLLADIADESDPLDGKTLALHEAVASLATELAEHTEAHSRWSLVAERTETPVRRASALLAASRAAYALQRVSEARELLRRSNEIDVDDDVLHVEQRTHEAGILLWLEMNTAQGRALAREAVAMASALASEAGGVEVLDAPARRAYLGALQLEYEAAVQEGDAGALLPAAEAREAAARGFELEAYLAASLAVGTALDQNGRVDEAAVRYRSLWVEAHRRILPGLIVDAGYMLADTHLRTGNLIEAEQIIGEVVELAARAGDVPRARHRVARVACGIALERGRPRDALTLLEHETAAEPNEHQRIAYHADLAVWYARLGETEASALVAEQLALGRACSDAVGCPRCAREFQVLSAEALARIGRPDEARQALAHSPGVRQESDELLRSIMLRHADALAEAGAEDRAVKLKTALEAVEHSGFGLELLWIQLDLGRALAEAGSSEAVAVLGGAASAAHDRGAGTVQELAEQALRSLGVRTWRRGRSRAPLTLREEEVARLVSSGATNREIAEALFLSPKTVERHISNALRKVGARNRTELAERLRDLGAEHAGNAR